MIEQVKTTDNSPKLLGDALQTTEKQSVGIEDSNLIFGMHVYLMELHILSVQPTRNKHICDLPRQEATVDAEKAAEAASVCGGKSHFAAKLRICLPRHAEASRDPRHDAESMVIFKSKSFLND
ncbi:hypothetical protein DPMN_019657 [Dreissena polymorpha]|uniref:Uncharacterized protein n=1 Tax=Dreissena polymorpha TaxID=45954 RepID=A0A9D4NFE3_DREPO|nr:hypothetical protein DPMN_019657 [Dreissena polymorpha]